MLNVQYQIVMLRFVTLRSVMLCYVTFVPFVTLRCVTYVISSCVTSLTCGMPITYLEILPSMRSTTFFASLGSIKSLFAVDKKVLQF